MVARSVSGRKGVSGESMRPASRIRMPRPRERSRERPVRESAAVRSGASVSSSVLATSAWMLDSISSSRTRYDGWSVYERRRSKTYGCRNGTAARKSRIGPP